MKKREKIKYLKIIGMEINPYGIPYLNTDILKSILEIKLNKNENVSMIGKKIRLIF